MTALVTVNSALTITNDLLNNMVRLSEMNLEAQEHWLAEASQALQKWSKAQDFTVMMEAQVLYTVHKAWGTEEEEGLLRREVQAPWGYDFFKWAKTFTKRGARMPANATILNKISVFRDWIAEKNIEYPESVFIPKRDVFGELLGPELLEENDWEEVPFNPIECDYGKLLIARGTAREGILNDHAWTALRDPFATVEDLNNALKGSKENKKSNGTAFRIYQVGGLLYAEEENITCAFLAIIPECLSQTVGRKALARIKKVLGLPEGNERLELSEMLVYNLASVAEDKLIICIEGIKFAEFNWEEAKQIKEAIEQLERKLEKNGKIIN